MYEGAVNHFTKEFKTQPDIAACAPGRVNLIGEHTDYNDGFVFPMALPMVTVVVGKKNGKQTCSVVTMAKEADSPTRVEFPVPSKQKLTPGEPKWANYVKGVVQNFKGSVLGFDAVIDTSVPIGGGLSSSASLEVAVYTFLEALTGQTTQQKKEKALACQAAEHDFANMPCGIMDQFIATMGEKGTALFIDCRSMEAKSVPMTDPEIAIIITDSKVKHNLASSAYAERRQQCYQGAQILGKSSLRDATLPQLQALKNKELLYKRAKHVVTENNRTEQAAKALQEGNLKKFGELMNESHESLRTDYEVSCSELDELVNAARSCPHVLGSRMTGGGFGGCTVTLATAKHADKVIDAIKNNTKLKPTFYITKPSGGARVLSIPK
ncbi:hypothetical protein L9F63_012354 [Diploptera punctata]|uniref:Galactokinase n=1 Tax=Diploptera punctata TaxID=6984 RepID=A0AAD8AE40_DIPPU|nr:hypothetical protein L9F63_012354 [Diploptera punctata]